ncbi:hypothetical protein ACH474_04015 [Nocardia rhamnosiphila]|nr:hypothetical protein [Nocardia rhamnosiphila]
MTQPESHRVVNRDPGKLFEAHDRTSVDSELTVIWLPLTRP